MLRDDDPAVVGAPDALGRPAMIGMVAPLPRAPADVVSELMRRLRRLRQRRDALGVAGPAELTACAVMICRRVVGPGRVEPPCSLRLLARPEGQWIRMTVIAHGNSSHLEPVAATPHAANGARILVEKPDPLAASVLVARAAPRGAGGRAGLPGTVP